MIVWVTYSAPEAHIIAGRLESEGIPAMVYSEPGAAALGIHIGSLGEVKVLVRPHDYERALAALEPDMPGTLPDTTGNVIYRPPDDEDDDE